MADANDPGPTGRGSFGCRVMGCRGDEVISVRFRFVIATAACEEGAELDMSVVARATLKQNQAGLYHTIHGIDRMNFD